MIYITQLIYIIAGKENIFNQFEGIAIPIISKCNRPTFIKDETW